MKFPYKARWKTETSWWHWLQNLWGYSVTASSTNLAYYPLILPLNPIRSGSLTKRRLYLNDFLHYLKTTKKLLDTSFFLHRKLTEFKSKVDVLQKESAELHDAVVIFQNEVAGLKSEKAKLKDVNVKQKFEIELTGQIINKVRESISLNKVQQGK